MTEQASPETWPSGVMALVFTDVERSTELWQIDEDAFGWALMEHDHEVRDVLGRHRGFEIKHTGDGFFLVFADVGSAARFCLDLQTRLTRHDWPPELGPVRTRIGVHYGRPRRYGSDYRGSSVSLASRVCEASQGGQILVSGEAAEGLRAWADLSTRLDHLGQFELAGISEPVELYELRCDATRHLQFAPVGSRPPRRETAPPQGDSAMSTSSRFNGEDQAAWNRAREALKRADHETAIAELLELLGRHPDDVRVLSMLGVAFAWREQYDRAEHCLRRAVEIDDTHATAWFNLARVYGKMGRRDEIGRALAMALRADPSHAKARAVAAKYGVEIPGLPEGDPPPAR